MESERGRRQLGRAEASTQALLLLRENPARIATLTAPLTAAQLHAAPAPNEWSANDVLGHLRSCADVWGGAIGRLIEADTPTIRVVSPRGRIKRTNYRHAEFRTSFLAFVAQRDELLALLEPLAREGWSRTATVKGAGKVSTITVLDLAQKLALHEQHHLDQFARIAKGSNFLKS
jgi:hypothetical protein